MFRKIYICMLLSNAAFAGNTIDFSKEMLIDSHKVRARCETSQNGWKGPWIVKLVSNDHGAGDLLVEANKRRAYDGSKYAEGDGSPEGSCVAKASLLNEVILKAEEKGLRVKLSRNSAGWINVVASAEKNILKGVVGSQPEPTPAESH